MLDDKTIDLLLSAALQCNDGDRYLSEWATSSLFDTGRDDQDPDYDAISDLLHAIYRAAHITVREIRTHTGLTQAAFALRYHIPKRSVENWEGGTRACPDYVRLMLAQLTGAAPLPINR